jgi:hypothetical protein
MRWYWWLAIAAAALAILGGTLQVTGTVEIIGPIVDFTQRGSKVGPSTKLESDKLIHADPYSLAEEVGVDPNTYALARVIRSEAGALDELAKLSVAYVVFNEARNRDIDVLELVTRPQGFFGAQNAGGKFVSTRLDPYELDVTIAKSVGITLDPTNGATRFDSPKAQRALLARSEKGYNFTPEEIAESRSKKFHEVAVAGLDPEDIRFWRPNV